MENPLDPLLMSDCVTCITTGGDAPEIAAADRDSIFLYRILPFPITRFVSALPGMIRDVTTGYIRRAVNPSANL